MAAFDCRYAQASDYGLDERQLYNLVVLSNLNGPYGLQHDEVGKVVAQHGVIGPAELALLRRSSSGVAGATLLEPVFYRRLGVPHEGCARRGAFRPVTHAADPLRRSAKTSSNKAPLACSTACLPVSLSKRRTMTSQ